MVGNPEKRQAREKLVPRVLQTDQDLPLLDAALQKKAAIAAACAADLPNAAAGQPQAGDHVVPDLAKAAPATPSHLTCGPPGTQAGLPRQESSSTSMTRQRGRPEGLSPWLWAFKVQNVHPFQCFWMFTRVNALNIMCVCRFLYQNVHQSHGF